MERKIFGAFRGSERYVVPTIIVILIPIVFSSCENPPQDSNEQVNWNNADTTAAHNEKAWAESDMVSSNYSMNYVAVPSRQLVNRVKILEFKGARPDFEDNFERSGTKVSNVWRHSGNGRAHISNDVAREGKKSLKFNVKANEGTNYRDELVFNGGPLREMGFGENWWFGFSIYVPRDWKSDTSGDIFFQVHRSPDDHDPKGVTANPPIAISIQGSRMEFRQRWDGQDPWRRHKHSFDRTVKILDKVKSGRWYDFVVHFVWSKKKGSGLTECWLDGKKVYTQSGPNTYVDKKGPFLKFGIYKPLWKRNSYTNASAKRGITQRVYYYDNMRIYKGSKGFDVVKPTGVYQKFEEEEEVLLAERLKLKVYPNPVVDYVNVERPEGFDGNLLVHVLDLAGNFRVREKWGAESKKKRIQLSHLRPGVYVIRAMGEQKILSGKIIVN